MDRDAGAARHGDSKPTDCGRSQERPGRVREAKGVPAVRGPPDGREDTDQCNVDQNPDHHRTANVLNGQFLPGGLGERFRNHDARPFGWTACGEDSNFTRVVGRARFLAMVDHMETAFQDNPVHTVGELPAEGGVAPSFELVGTDLSPVSLDDFQGRKVVLNIFPSLDTGVCAASVRRFNELAAGLQNTSVVCVSADLPFAQERFCGAEGIDNVSVASSFRSRFGKDWGVEMTDGPLEALLARSVVVLDADHKVIYTQLVPEITQEPDYDDAVAALG